MQKPPDYFVQAFDRGLAVIRAFGPGAAALSIADVAGRIGVPRPAARRFLLTLVDLGYARKSGRTFELTSKVMDLGFSYLASLQFPQFSQPYLQQLAQALNETCSIVVRDGADIVYVARAFVEQVMPSPINLGSRLPAFATAGGRVLLASLPAEERGQVLAASALRKFTPQTVARPPELLKILERVHKQGYAVVEEELSAGLRTMAVPVRNRAGETLAALTASGHVWRQTREAMVQGHLPAMRATAQALTNHLG